MAFSRGSRYGHLTVMLRRPGVGKRVSVHVLVAEAFLGPCPDALEVRHINGVGWDNRAENLVYGTRAQNMSDSVRHGTHNQARKTHCPRNHLLEAPNLDAYALPRRACSACRMARNRFNSSNITPTPAELQTLSDEIYTHLMKGEVA
jgi:hypothetical protein